MASLMKCIELEVSITLMLKADKYITRKLQIKFPNTVLASQTQQYLKEITH